MANAFSVDHKIQVSATMLLIVVGATLAALTSPDGYSTTVNNHHHTGRTVPVRRNDGMLEGEKEERANEQEELSHRSGHCQLGEAGDRLCEDVCFPNGGKCVNGDSHHSASHCACIVGEVINDSCMDVSTEIVCTHNQMTKQKDYRCFCKNQQCECRDFNPPFMGHLRLALEMAEQESYDSLCKPGNVHQNACPNGMVGYCLPPMDISTLMPILYHCLIASGETSRGFITLIEANVCLVIKAPRKKNRSSWKCRMDMTLHLEKACVMMCPEGTTGHYVRGNIEDAEPPVCNCVVPPVGKNFPELLTLQRAIQRFPLAGREQQKHVSCATNAQFMDSADCKAVCKGLNKVCDCEMIRDKDCDRDVVHCKCVNAAMRALKKINPLKLLKKKQKLVTH